MNPAFGNENKDMKTTTENFGSKMTDKVQEGSSVPREHLMKMGSNALTSASEEISKGYDAARRGLSEAGSQVETFVKKNPLIAISASAGLGWALGRLLAPRQPHRNTHV